MKLTALAVVTLALGIGAGFALRGSVFDAVAKPPPELRALTAPGQHGQPRRTIGGFGDLADRYLGTRLSRTVPLLLARPGNAQPRAQQYPEQPGAGHLSGHERIGDKVTRYSR